MERAQRRKHVRGRKWGQIPVAFRLKACCGAPAGQSCFEFCERRRRRRRRISVPFPIKPCCGAPLLQPCFEFCQTRRARRDERRQRLNVNVTSKARPVDARIAYDPPRTAESRSQGGSRQTPKRGKLMTKLFAVALALTTLLLIAPVIESETSGTSQIFVTIGNADGSGGE